MNLCSFYLYIVWEWIGIRKANIHMFRKRVSTIYSTKPNSTQSNERTNEWYLHILGKTRRIYSPKCNLTKMSRTSTSSDWSWNWTQMTVHRTLLSFPTIHIHLFLVKEDIVFLLCRLVSFFAMHCSIYIHPIRLLALAAYSYHPFRKRLSIFGLTFIFGTENWDIKKKLEYNVMSKKLTTLYCYYCVYVSRSYGIWNGLDSLGIIQKTWRMVTFDIREGYPIQFQENYFLSASLYRVTLRRGRFVSTY